MSTRLIQSLHAGISRRDWSAVETAANAIRDESEKVRRSLAATDFGSLPADYSTLRMVEDRMEQLSRFYTAPQTKEPVAWRWRSTLFTEWNLSDKPPVDQATMERTMELNMVGLEWEALYASPTLQTDVKALEDRIAELEDELHDAQQVPWPEWANKILKVARSYSGYDGYDDATDGVDIVGEVEEALSELYSEAERLRASSLPPQSILHAPKTIEEAWDLFDSRVFTHGHREKPYESFIVALKNLFPADDGNSVIGTTYDGVKILAPAVASKNFTPAEVRAAIAKAESPPPPQPKVYADINSAGDGWIQVTLSGDGVNDLKESTIERALSTNSAAPQIKSGDWTPPPESERLEGFQCLAFIPVRWERSFANPQTFQWGVIDYYHTIEGSAKGWAPLSSTTPPETNPDDRP